MKLACVAITIVFLVATACASSWRGMSIMMAVYCRTTLRLEAMRGTRTSALPPNALRMATS